MIGIVALSDDIVRHWFSLVARARRAALSPEHPIRPPARRLQPAARRGDTNMQHLPGRLLCDAGRHAPMRLPHRPVLGRARALPPSRLWHRTTALGEYAPAVAAWWRPATG